MEEGFIKFLLPFYANRSAVQSPFEIQNFVNEIEAGDYNAFSVVFKVSLQILLMKLIRV